MLTANILYELKRSLSPVDAPYVYSALRADLIVWDFVCDEQNLEKISPETRREPQTWSPANLSLIALGASESIEALKADHFPKIESGIRKRALESFETFLKNRTAPRNLEEAGLIALALRERRRKTYSWAGLPEELINPRVSEESNVAQIWETPLLCLSGMIADQTDLLESLVPSIFDPVRLKWISHIITANPTPILKKQQTLMDLFIPKPLEYQVEWLRLLQGLGQENLAQLIAEEIIQNNLEFLTSLKEPFSPEFAPWADISRKILGNEIAAMLYQACDHQDAAKLHLSKTKELLQHWVLANQVQLSKLNFGDHDASTPQSEDLKVLLRIFPASEKVLFDAAPTMISEEMSDNVVNDESIFDQIAYAKKLAMNGQLAEAQNITRQAVQTWLKNTKQNPALITFRYGRTLEFLPFIDDINSLRLVQTAIELAETVSEFQPENIKLKKWLFENYINIGDSEKALQIAYHNLLTEPNNLESARGLARLLEKNNNYDVALEEWRSIVTHYDNHNSDDAIGLAHCAFKGRQYSEAINVCNDILLVDQENWRALIILGSALAESEKISESIEKLKLATEVHPEESLPWIKLAEVYVKSGDDHQAMEILRSASLALPDSAQIQYKLGKINLDNGFITEAIPYLRQSATLAPESDEVTIDLVKTLITLGREDEAREALKIARKKWPAQSELAFLEAKIYFNACEFELAKNSIETALKSTNPLPEWLIIFARSILQDAGNPFVNLVNSIDISKIEIAQKALTQTLQISSGIFDARVLLAEIEMMKGNHLKAYELYEELIKSPEYYQDEWTWRLQGGFGLAAFHVGEFQTAVVALTNAVKTNPQSIGGYRYLAEAAAYVGEIDICADAAEKGLVLSDHDVDVVRWFSELMCKIGKHQRAVDALIIASERFPDHTGIRVQLAKMSMLSGDKATAVTMADSIRNMLELTSEDLRQIAVLYLDGDLAEKALKTLEEADRTIPEPLGELKFELSLLNERSGDLDNSITYIKSAIGLQPDQVKYYVFLSELENRVNRPQAAIAALETAVTILEKSTQENISQRKPLITKQGTDHHYDLPFVWNPAAIYLRYAQLLYRVGSYALALNSIERSLELDPGNIKTRFIGAEIASVLLDYEKVNQICQIPALNDGKNCLAEFSSDDEENYWIAGIYGIQTEIALDQGKQLQAEKFTSDGLAYFPSHPRLLASEVSVLARQGDFDKAEAQFKGLKDQLNQTENLPFSIEFFEVDSVDTRKKHPYWWALGRAAQELKEWNGALGINAEYALIHHDHPRALLAYLKTLVSAAEWQLMVNKLSLEKRAVGESVFEPTNYHKFSQVVSDLRKLCQSDEIERWYARGEVNFHPSTASLKILASVYSTDSDAAALINALGRLGNVESAAQIGSQFPESCLVNIQLGLLDSAEFCDQAYTSAVKACKLEPHNPLALATLARAAQRTGDLTQALEAIETALLFWQNEPAWEIWAGELAEKCEQFSSAVQHLERANQLTPGKSTILSSLAKIYLKVGAVSSAIQTLETAVYVESEDSNLWVTLAEAYLAGEDYQSGLRSIDKAVNLNNQNPDAYILGGELSLAMGNLEMTEKYIRAAIDHKPSDVRTRILAAKLLLHQGKEKTALKDIEKALEEFPGNAEVETFRLAILYKMNGTGKILPEANQVAARYPDSPAIQNLLAHIQADHGDLELAEVSGLRSLKLDPHQPDLHLLMGKVFSKTGQLDKAVFHLSEVVRISPNNVEAYMELGKVYTNRREVQQALDAYQQAVRHDPADFRPFYNSAILLKDSKDYLGAEAMLRKAAQLAPNDVNIRRQLGAIIALNLVQNCQEADVCN